MRSWTLSCADFTFPLLPHELSLQLIRMLGFQRVDLGIFSQRSHVRPESVADDPASAASAVRQRLNGLAVADVFLQTGADPHLSAANTPSAAERSRNRATFASVLEFALALDCRHLTGLPGVRHAGLPEADDWARTVDEAAWRVRQAAAVGVVYAVEPHVGSITADAEATARLLNEVEGLTLTLDYGHFTYLGIPQADVHRLLPHASHLHARGGAAGRLQVNMSRNTIDFADIARRLDAAAYAGSVCVEYVWIDWQGCNESDNLSETITLKAILEAA